MVSGTFTADGVSIAIGNGRLLGDQITFTIGATEYAGLVSADAMAGSGWNATRSR